MIFIKTTEDNIVSFIHYKPFDSKDGLGKTKEELEQEGVLVESVPKPENIEGRTPILHCNPETKELWYEYVVSEFTITADKKEIIADGEDTALITVYIPKHLDANTAYFIVNGEPQVEEVPIVDDVAQLEIAFTDAGLYLIEVIVGDKSKKIVLKGVAAWWRW